MRAYCWASGLIEFGPTLPEDALPIARGRERTLRPFIEGNARHGYSTVIVDGRPTKVPGSDTLLVPGIPESGGDQSKALDALYAFRKWLAKQPPKGITI